MLEPGLRQLLQRPPARAARNTTRYDRWAWPAPRSFASPSSARSVVPRVTSRQGWLARKPAVRSAPRVSLSPTMVGRSSSLPIRKQRPKRPYRRPRSPPRKARSGAKTQPPVAVPTQVAVPAQAARSSNSTLAAATPVPVAKLATSPKPRQPPPLPAADDPLNFPGQSSQPAPQPTDSSSSTNAAPGFLDKVSQPASTSSPPRGSAQPADSRHEPQPLRSAIPCRGRREAGTAAPEP